MAEAVSLLLLSLSPCLTPFSNNFLDTCTVADFDMDRYEEIVHSSDIIAFSADGVILFF